MMVKPNMQQFERAQELARIAREARQKASTIKGKFARTFQADFWRTARAAERSVRVMANLAIIEACDANGRARGLCDQCGLWHA
ncbi:MAG: hypothetical protein RL268_498 [Pseudomonadota bacterium]|jgi:hypothetical protein